MSAHRHLALLAVLGALVVLMALRSEHFLTWANLLGTTRHLAEVGIVACGMTLVVVTGGIDLSVGSLLALSGVLLGLAWSELGLALPLAAALAVLAAAAGGTLNGLLVTRAGFPPLVATLGTMALYRGLALRLSEARPVSGFPSAFTELGQGHLGPVPVQTLLWAAVAAAAAWLLHRGAPGAAAPGRGRQPGRGPLRGAAGRPGDPRRLRGHRRPGSASPPWCRQRDSRPPAPTPAWASSWRSSPRCPRRHRHQRRPRLDGGNAARRADPGRGAERAHPRRRRAGVAQHGDGSYPRRRRSLRPVDVAPRAPAAGPDDRSRSRGGGTVTRRQLCAPLLAVLAACSGPSGDSAAPALSPSA